MVAKWVLNGTSDPNATSARRVSLLRRWRLRILRSRRPGELYRLVLLDYEQQTVDSRPYWTEDKLDGEMDRRP